MSMDRSLKDRRFVLLDRDGTINVERDYLKDPSELELLPGAAAGLRKLAGLGLGLVVVTNQSGVARGYFDMETVSRVHARLTDMLAAEGVRLDAIQVCPHGPKDGCRCRKPLPGMVEEAARALGFDPARSFMIGDKAADVELGRAVGATALLVRTGWGRQTEAAGDCHPAAVLDDLSAAADWIVRRLADATETIE